MEGKPPLALWFSHTGIIAYPPHCIQYLFSTPNTPLYSEMQIKTIPVKSNTSYLASITGRQMGHIIVLNSLSGWRQWYDGVITVGHIDIVPLIILSRNAILIEGQNGAINAVCGISIVDGDIKVTIPNGWNGKYSHLCIDISFLVN